MSTATESSGSTGTASTESPSIVNFSADGLVELTGIQTSPADAVVEACESWGELHSHIQDETLEQIDGVGPQSAEDIDAAASAIAANVEGAGSSESSDSDGAEEDEDTEPDAIENQDLPAEFDVQVDVSVFEDHVDALNRFVDEVKLFIYSDRMKVAAVDPANVAFAKSTLVKEDCESWQASPGVIGLDVVRFTDVIGMGDSDEVVSLSLESDNRLLINVGGVEYTLATIDPQTIRQVPEVPELDLPADATLHGSVLNRGIKAADMVSQRIRVEIDPQRGVVLSAEGDTDNVELVKGADGEGVEEINSGSDPVGSLFALEYVKKIKQIVKKNEDVYIEVGDESPLMMTVPQSDSGSSTEIVIAPRIEA